MEQKEFLKYISNLRGQLTDNAVVQVKKTYKGKKSLLTSNGQGKNSRIKLKGKKPNVSFACTCDPDKQVWNVIITAQTVKSACNVFSQKNINLNEDTEEKIMEKLEFPFMSVERANQLEAMLQSLNNEIHQLKTKVNTLEKTKEAKRHKTCQSIKKS